MSNERFDAIWRSDDVQDAMADDWAKMEREAKLQLQIEMAAKGCVSGTGVEWPYLLIALRHFGEPANETTPALELREASRRVCTKQGWRP